MGRTGSALDNAVIESWHSTLEFELLSLEHFATRAQTRARVAAWIDSCHRARKAAKRARYATELTSAHGHPRTANKSIKAYKRVQDVLGEHQDSAVAAQFLHRMGTAAAHDAHDGNGFTYGLLYQRELNLAQKMRERARSLNT